MLEIITDSWIGSESPLCTRAKNDQRDCEKVGVGKLHDNNFNDKELMY
jgi:hypothetical protein